MRAIPVTFLAVLAACGSRSSEPPAADPDGWQCFAKDPAAPSHPEGDVTYVRQRISAQKIESDSVFARGSEGGASRLVLTAVGTDHYEATVKDDKLTGRVLTPDGAHWVLTVKPPAGAQLDEDTVLAGGALTVTSIEGDTKTVTRFVPAPCADVVAALAKYP